MIKNRSGQEITWQLTALDGSAVTTGTTSVNYKGTATSYASAAGNATHAGAGMWYYAPSAAETNFISVSFQAVNSGGVTTTKEYHPVSDYPLEESTSRATSDNTIQLKSSSITPFPGAQLEITSGSFVGFCSNYSSYAPGTNTLTFDPPCVGLTGTPTYRIWGMAAAPTANPIDVDLSAAAITAIWNEVLTGHTTTATAGKVLSTLGDPWSTAIPGSYASGTAGYVLGNGVPLNLTAGNLGAIADALLNRNIRGGSATGRRVYEALSFLRNKWVVNDTAVPPTITVYDQDDTTILFTGVMGTSATFNAVTSLDPS